MFTLQSSIYIAGDTYMDVTVPSKPLAGLEFQSPTMLDPGELAAFPAAGSMRDTRDVQSRKQQGQS